MNTAAVLSERMQMEELVHGYSGLWYLDCRNYLSGWKWVQKEEKNKDIFLEVILTTCYNK